MPCKHRSLAVRLDKAKASELPPGGWTQEEFNTRNGARLVTDIIRVYRAVIGRTKKDFSIFLRGYFNAQLEALIDYVSGSPRTRKGAKAPTILDLGGSQEMLWAMAMEEVFRNANLDITIKVLPKYQSAAAQAYEQTSVLLGNELAKKNSVAILRRAQGLCQQVTRINNTTKDRLSSTINTGLKNDLTVTEMIALIRDRFPQIAENRIQTIARTEMHRAADEGVKQALRESKTVTHVSVIGCRAIEPGIPTYKGIPTCNIQNVPLADIDQLSFHPNHTGAIVASAFRDTTGAAPAISPTHTPAGAAPAHRIPDITELEKVRDLGGSTGAQLMRDRDTGKQWVVKSGNPGQLRDEWAADEVYRALKIRVPAGRLIDNGNQVYRITEFIEGDSLGDVMRGGDVARQARAIQEVQDGFVADAVVANWDVIGMGADNILVDKAGRAFRIDNGGAFRFRGMGTEKPFTEHAMELWTLRDKAINPNAAPFFESLDFFKIAGQIEALPVDKLIEAAPVALQATMKARLKNLADVGRKALDMEFDGWREGYADKLGRGIMTLRQEGWTASLSKELKIVPGVRNGGAVEMVDEAGNPWDHLRGSGGTQGAGERLFQILEKTFGPRARQVIYDWADGQGGDSWGPKPMAMKKIIVDSRTTPLADYYWQSSYSSATVRLDLLQAEYGYSYTQMRDIFATYHAAVQEIFDNVALPNVDRQRGLVRIMRTESTPVVNTYGMNLGDKATYYTRGPNESGSLVAPVEVYGKELIVQAVPTSKVTGFWGLGRRDSGRMDFFAGDYENECSFIGHETRVDYRSRVGLPGYWQEGGDKGSDAAKWGLHMTPTRAE